VRDAAGTLPQINVFMALDMAKRLGRDIAADGADPPLRIQ